LKWDKLIANKNNRLFRQCIALQFNAKASKNYLNNKQFILNNSKQANVSKISFSIPFRLSKSILAKSKFHKTISSSSLTFKPNGQSYIQALKININNIIKIKENFLKLLAQKVKEIHKVLNNSKKDKPRLNMTTKGLSRK